MKKKVEVLLSEIREDRLQQGYNAVPESFQGVSKGRIAKVLELLDMNTDDMRDAIFALLDNKLPNQFALKNDPTTNRNPSFSDGATTAQIGAHFGVLQRGVGKADREGRDYWIKPLSDIGAVEKILFHSPEKKFIPGHPIAKSPNSCYRLAPSFVRILQAPDPEYRALLQTWINEDTLRQRLELQAKLGRESARLVDNSHSDLIQSSIKNYARRFLPDFRVLYVDDADGDRVSEVERIKLAEAGIEIRLEDKMPDVILWDESRRYMWIIEAVTSDGEVDKAKVDNLISFAKRNNARHLGFTTTYKDWKTAGKRQGKHKNLVAHTYLWIEEDPGNNFYIKDLFRDTI